MYKEKLSNSKLGRRLAAGLLAGSMLFPGLLGCTPNGSKREEIKKDNGITDVVVKRTESMGSIESKRVALAALAVEVASLKGQPGVNDSKLDKAMTLIDTIASSPITDKADKVVEKVAKTVAEQQVASAEAQQLGTEKRNNDSFTYVDTNNNLGFIDYQKAADEETDRVLAKLLGQQLDSYINCINSIVICDAIERDLALDVYQGNADADIKMLEGYDNEFKRLTGTELAGAVENIAAAYDFCHERLTRTQTLLLDYKYEKHIRDMVESVGQIVYTGNYKDDEQGNGELKYVIDNKGNTFGIEFDDDGVYLGTSLGGQGVSIYASNEEDLLKGSGEAYHYYTGGHGLFNEMFGEELYSGYRKADDLQIVGNGAYNVEWSFDSGRRIASGNDAYLFDENMFKVCSDEQDSDGNCRHTIVGMYPYSEAEYEGIYQKHKEIIDKTLQNPTNKEAYDSAKKGGFFNILYKFGQYFEIPVKE